METSKLTRDMLLDPEKMPEDMRVRYGLVRQVDHLINSAIEKNRDFAKGHCVTLQYSRFIEQLYSAYSQTKQKRDCGQTALFDGLLLIAEYAYTAVKNIVNNPSRVIAKVEVKMPVSRAADFGNKTMRWLACRPGRDIAEKISPTNKVLTTKTVFSVDTKENRELMFLVKRLNEIISSKFSVTACATCNKQFDCREWAGHMKRLAAMYSHLKTDELGAVACEKQAVQNNKLMCDLNYKIVWDAVKMLSEVERVAESKINRFYLRFAQLTYWLIVGRIMRDRRAVLCDCIGKVEEDNGCVVFRDEVTATPHIKDEIIFKDPEQRYQRSLRAELSRTRIQVTDVKSRQNVFDIDVCDLMWV